MKPVVRLRNPSRSQQHPAEFRNGTFAAATFGITAASHCGRIAFTERPQQNQTLTKVRG